MAAVHDFDARTSADERPYDCRKKLLWVTAGPVSPEAILDMMTWKNLHFLTQSQTLNMQSL
jgi:hypothetical protein